MRAKPGTATVHDKAWALSLVGCVFALIAVFFATACSSKFVAKMSSSEGANAGSLISGIDQLVNHDGGALALAGDCQQPRGAYLYRFGDESKPDATPLMTSAVAADGSYSFDLDAGALEPVDAGHIAYTVLVKSCAGLHGRVVTKAKDDLTAASNLILYTVGEGETQQLTRAFGKDKIAAFAALVDKLGVLNKSSDTAEIYETLAQSAELSAAYKQLFGLPVTALRDAPPKILQFLAPAKLAFGEGKGASFGVSVVHWRTDYKVATIWQIDDVTLSTERNFVYTPGANSQGLHTLSLIVGEDKVEAESSRQKYALPVSVTNDLPAQAPVLTLLSAAVAARPAAAVGSRTVTLGLETGHDLSECASFSRLAVTENTATVPESFDLTCQKEGVQSFDFTLATAGDGLKTLRLWVIDAAGNISQVPAQLSLLLETTPPVFSALPLADSVAGGYLNAATKALAVSLVGSVSGANFDAAAYHLALASTACDASLTYDAAPPLADNGAINADDVYHVCVKLTDMVGHAPAFGASASFTVKTTLPAFTSVALAGDAVNGSINASEHTHGTTSLVASPGGANFDQAVYALVGAAVVCDGSLAYAAVPPTAAASGLGADGSYKVCVKLVDNAGNQPAYGASPVFSLAATAPGAFSVTAPATLTGSATPAVSWGAASGSGISYNLKIASSSGCASPLQTYASLASTNQVLTTLGEGAYYACLEATDAAGNKTTAANSPFAFTVDLTPPGTFSLSSPASGSYTNSSTLALTWGAAAGAAAYDVKLGTAAGCASAAESHLNLAATTLTTGALADGTYYICLSAKDAAGNATAASNTNATVVVDTQAPGSFSLTAPSPLTSAAGPSVTWGASTGAATYRLDIAAASNCASPLQTYAALSTTSQTLTSLADGTYYACLKAADAATNSTTAANSPYAFRVDTSAPATTSLSVNGGSASTSNNYVTVDLAGSDTASNVTQFCLKYNSTTRPTAADACWVPVNAPQPGLTPAPTLAMSHYTFRLGFGPGSYSIYAWLMDAAQNISTLSAAGAGTAGVDKATITYTPGTPPSVVNILAANSDAPANTPTASDFNVPLGSDVYIKWQVTASNGLGSGPVSLYYTTDDAVYTPIVSGLTNAANGSCQPNNGSTTADDSDTGCYLWSGGSPTNGYFRIRVSVTDSAGMTTNASSPALNVSQIGFLAGNTEVGIGGSATSAVFFNETSSIDAEDAGSLVVLPTGEVYFRDIYRGLYYVSPNNGKLQLLIPTTGTASGDGGPASAATLRLPLRLALDAQNRVLIFDYNRIRRIDTTVNPATISTVIGGGSSTVDGVSPLAVGLSYPGGFVAGSVKYMIFFVLPNGDIYFQSDRYSYNTAASTFRVRVLSHATDTVSSVQVGGTGSSFDSSIDLASCLVRSLGFTYDLASSAITGATATFMYSHSNPSCYTSYTSSYSYGYAALNPTTFTSLPAPYPAYTSPSGSFVQGMNGGLYYITRRTGQIQRYNAGTKDFTNIVGTGTAGTCADGTAALSCAIDPQDAFVTASGALYFMDRGRLRTLDDSNNVITIMGQSKSFGDGGKAVSARFNEVNSIDLWNNDTVVTLDAQEVRLREFTVGSTISTIAGNGLIATPNTTALANAQSITVSSSGTYFDDFAVNSVTGDVALNLGLSYIGLLTRSSGKWTKVAGNGSTTYYDPTADGRTGLNINITGNYLSRPIGFDGTGYAVHLCSFSGSTLVASMIKRYAAADGLQTNILGSSGPSGSGVCADGTAGDACVMDNCYSSNFARATYDGTDGRWLLLHTATKGIRSIVPGGNIATLTTTVNDANAFAYKRSADLTTNIVYYCSTSGRIYKRDVNASTESALAWPITSMSCVGRSLIYNSTRNSLIFPYKQNNLIGIAEYLNP